MRPIHAFMFLIALAVAGCAGTSSQTAPNALGGAPQRPKAVVVYDFDFSSNVDVLDREFISRLERQLGDVVVGKQIARKRVNDEIVVTIATILRDEAGLTAQPGSDDSLALKDNALVITGQVHAVDQTKYSQLNPANFGANDLVVVDVSLSQVIEGTKKQLLAFTVHGQNARKLPASFTSTRDAAIAAMLSAKSAPDVKLSPSIEAQARAIGRAIADRIVSYATQQGWVNKADLPAPMAEVETEQKRLNRSPAADVKNTPPLTQSGTIPCSAFTKNDRGNWYVRGPVTFDIGTVQNKTLQNMEIPPKFFNIGGVDLYDALQKKCGGRQRP